MTATFNNHNEPTFLKQSLISVRLAQILLSYYLIKILLFDSTSLFVTSNELQITCHNLQGYVTWEALPSVTLAVIYLLLC